MTMKNHRQIHKQSLDQGTEVVQPFDIVIVDEARGVLDQKLTFPLHVCRDQLNELEIGGREQGDQAEEAGSDSSIASLTNSHLGVLVPVEGGEFREDDDDTMLLRPLP